MELLCEINGKKYLRMERLFYLTWRFSKRRERITAAFEEIGAISRKIVKYEQPFWNTPYVIIEYLVPVDKIKEFNDIDIRKLIRRR